MTQSVKNIIKDKALGTFFFTGEEHPPRVGEYYLCKRINGVARATQMWKVSRRILEPCTKGAACN